MAVVKLELKTIGGRLMQRTTNAARKAIDDLVRSTQKLGPATNKASRQMRSALQNITIKKLQKEFDATKTAAEKMGLTMGQLGSAFGRLKGAVNSGTISMQKFHTNVSNLRNNLSILQEFLNKAASAAEKNKKATDEGAQASRKFAQRMTNLAQQIRLVRGPLDGVAARVSTFAAIVRTGAATGAALAASITIVGAAAGALAAALFSTQRAFEPLIMRFRIAEGSFEAARNEMAFVRQEADRLGSSFRTSARNFSSFSAAARSGGFSGEEVRQIFAGFSTAISALDLPAVKIERVFLALEQMAAKGTVSMEELRRQLGDSLPNAIPVAAKALEVGTDELLRMIEAGEVLSKDLLPKMAKVFEEDLGEIAAISTLNKELNRMVDVLQDISRIILFGLGIDKFFTTVLKMARTALEVIRDFVIEVVNLFRLSASTYSQMFGGDPIEPYVPLNERDPGTPGPANVQISGGNRSIRDLEEYRNLMNDFYNSSFLKDKAPTIELQGLQNALERINELRKEIGKDPLTLTPLSMKQLSETEQQIVNVETLSVAYAEARDVIKSIETPLEKHERELARLQTLYKLLAINLDTYEKRKKQLEDSFNKANLDKAAKIMEANRTPLEKYNAELDELIFLFNKGFIPTFDEFSKAAKRLRENFNGMTDALRDLRLESANATFLLGKQDSGEIQAQIAGVAALNRHLKENGKEALTYQQATEGDLTPFEREVKLQGERLYHHRQANTLLSKYLSDQEKVNIAVENAVLHLTRAGVESETILRITKAIREEAEKKNKVDEEALKKNKIELTSLENARRLAELNKFMVNRADDFGLVTGLAGLESLNETLTDLGKPMMSINDLRTANLKGVEAEAFELGVLNSQLEMARQFYLESLTPMEQYALRLETINKLNKAGLLPDAAASRLLAPKTTSLEGARRQNYNLLAQSGPPNDISMQARIAGLQQLNEHLAENEQKERTLLSLREYALTAEEREAFALGQRNFQLETAKELYEATRTPLEIYSQRVDDLKYLLDEGEISQDTFNRAMEQAGNTLAQTDERIAALSTGFRSFGSTLVSSLRQGKGALASFSSAFSSFAETIASKLIEIYVVDQLVSGFGSLFGSILGGGGSQAPQSTGSGGGGSFGFLGTSGTVNPPTRAGGGPVLAGRGYIVGERGREMFVPGVSGNIVSNDNMMNGGRGGTAVNVNIYNESDGEVETRDNGNGIDVFIKKAIAQDITGGGRVFQAISKTYGIKPKVTTRG